MHGAVLLKETLVFVLWFITVESIAQTVTETNAKVATAANPEPSGAIRLEQVEVQADYDVQTRLPFLPDVEGTRINAGKRTSNIDAHYLPEVRDDQWRQITATTPGLVVPDENTTLTSMAYRGFDPHRLQSFQVLEDGIPIQADMIGYPEAYYLPPTYPLETMEFIRGGAALMYGPQPAGAINFVMKKPPFGKKFTVESITMGGSYDYISSFNAVGGTVDNVGYYGWFNHRQSQGFREANSQYDLNNGNLTMALDADTKHRWYFKLNGYEECNGEPGGLRLNNDTVKTPVNYNVDRAASSRFSDEFQLNRYAASVIHESEFSDDLFFSYRAWFDYYRRWSRRQEGGGFGTLPTQQTTQLETQQFYTWGMEPRWRWDWDLGSETQTLTAGFMVYNTTSPRTDQRGMTPTSNTGQIRNQSDRSVWYAPFFLENKFTVGDLSVVPGFRMENIWQSVDEKINQSKFAAGQPIGTQNQNNFVPLVGLGLEHKLPAEMAIYANVSEAYRPPTFAQAVPTGPNLRVSGNLQEGTVWNYEAGLRGTPTEWLSLDTSGFCVDYSNQIGETAQGGVNTVSNSGRSRVYGWDFLLQVDLVGVADGIAHGNVGCEDQIAGSPIAGWSKEYGALHFYTALTLQNGNFINGPNEGKTPQYLSNYVYKTGLVYDWQAKVKASFLGTYVGHSYASDNNLTGSDSRFIPAYNVWDLTWEAKLWNEYVSLVGGINNLFNKQYYARIRGDGIDPAMPRNWYAGLKITF
jgi:Fe(3+) dicitrate transport protein